MLENVRGLLHPRFDTYRQEAIIKPLEAEGYVSMGWQLLEARQFGVPQLRLAQSSLRYSSRTQRTSNRPGAAEYGEPPTVGEALRHEMGRKGWKGADTWARNANGIAPTLVGGSKKHGGPDLGPTQARKQWEKLGVNGKLVALDPPDRYANGEMPSDRAHGRDPAGVPGRLAILGEEDRRIPSGRQRVSAPVAEAGISPADRTGAPRCGRDEGDVESLGPELAADAFGDVQSNPPVAVSPEPLFAEPT